MRLGKHNIFSAMMKKAKPTLVALLILTTAWPAELQAVSVGGLMGFSSFKNLVLVIAMVNRAMRDAAENPMDEWRRQNVRHAVSLMPAAIIGLAKDFQAGKLHNGDLPMVQSILGGFVDVSAPDNYKKFLTSPDKKLIPKVGAKFPVVDAPAGPYGPNSQTRVGYDDSARPGASSSGGATVGKDREQIKVEAMPNPDQLVSLSPKTASAIEPSGKTDDSRIGFDDKFVREDSAGGASVGATDFASTRSASTAPIYGTSGPSSQVPGGFLQEAAREISSIESKVQPNTDIRILRRTDGAKDQKKEDDDFFKVTRPGKSDGKDAGRGRPRADAGDTYKLTVKPKFWKVSPLIAIVEAALMEKEARAEESGCQDCGGGGEGGGGGGGEAAQILFGIAAIIAAIAPMVVASIQAKADIKIAQINADTQKELTKMTAETSKYLADQQKDIALKQSNLAAQISEKNNGSVTQRLELQLAELRSAREEAAAAEKERRELEKQYQAERIALAQKQADDNLKLAKQTLNAQLTQAGLSSGFVNSRNSGTGLSVDRPGTGATASAGAATANVGAGAATGDAGAATGTAFRSTSTTNQVRNMVAATVTETQTQSAAAAPASQLVQPGIVAGQGAALAKTGANAGTGSGGGSAQLLRSMQPESGRKMASLSVDEMEEDEEYIVVDGKRVRRTPAKRGSTRAARGARGARGGRGVQSVGKRLAEVLENNVVVAGSTVGRKAYGGSATAKDGSKSDLKAFINTTAKGMDGSTGTFASYRETTRNNVEVDSTPRGRGVRTVTAHPEATKGAYNAADIGEAGGHSGEASSNFSFNLPGLPGFGGGNE